MKLKNKIIKIQKLKNKIKKLKLEYKKEYNTLTLTKDNELLKIKYFTKYLINFPKCEIIYSKDKIKYNIYSEPSYPGWSPTTYHRYLPIKFKKYNPVFIIDNTKLKKRTGFNCYSILL